MPLPNPLPHNPAIPFVKVQANIPLHIKTYLLHGALRGVAGAETAIISTIFKHLYDECKQLNLPDHFDLDNESIVAGLLSRVNFRAEGSDSTPPPTPTGLSTPIPNPVPGTSNDGRPTPRVHPEPTHPDTIAPNAQGKAPRRKRDPRREVTKKAPRKKGGKDGATGVE